MYRTTLLQLFYLFFRHTFKTTTMYSPHSLLYVVAISLSLFSHPSIASLKEDIQIFLALPLTTSTTNTIFFKPTSITVSTGTAPLMNQTYHIPSPPQHLFSKIFHFLLPILLKLFPLHHTKISLA